MATRTLGTNANNSLTALKFLASMADADVATIDQLIVDDQNFVNQNLGPAAASLQTGIIMSGTTATGSAAVTTVTVTTPAGAVLSGVIGSNVYGPGIPAGTIIISVAGTTLNLSAPCTANATVTFFAIATRKPGSFSKNGLLYVPNRGVLKLLPGDAIAVDATGWPVLVSAQALAFSGTSWTIV